MGKSEQKSRAARPGFDSLEQEVFLNLWRTYDRLREHEEQLFARFGLTPQQYNVLRLLAHAHPQPIQTLELAGRLVSRAPDITRLLDKLEYRGLVQRTRPSENRRVVSVAITADGEQMLVELRGPLADCHRKQLGHLRRPELRELNRLLHAARFPHESENSRWR